MQFHVNIFDPQRGIVRKRVDAPDEHAAILRLGVAPGDVLSVQPEQPSAAAMLGARRFPLRLFCQELAVLLAAGIPLLEALAALSEKESSSRTESALREVIEHLRAGETLSSALQARPEAFDALFVAMIESSERTGQIERALREHAAYLGWVEQLRTKLVSACIYPATLIVSGFTVVLFLLLFVVPRFAGVLESAGGDLPDSSRALIAIGRLGGEHPMLTSAVVLSLLATPIFAWRSPRLRTAFSAYLQRLPLISPKLRLLALAQLYRTASMLIGAGVPVVPALSNAMGVAGANLQTPLEQAISAIRNGERLSAALEQQGLTTPVSLRMLRVGEHSGEVGPMFGQAAAFYDEELSRLTELVTKLINPILMLLMGTIIGGVVILMYLPIFQLADQIQ